VEVYVYELNWPLFIALSSLVISIFGLYNSWKSRINNEKFWIKEQYYKSLSEAVKIEPSYEHIVSEATESSIVIYNKSDFKVYDVVVLQGLNNMDLFNGQCISKVCYIREIRGGYSEHFTMRHKGLGMSKFLVIGVFFRDFQGKEWFRDSYGITKNGEGYKDRLSHLHLISPPYPRKIDNQ